MESTYKVWLVRRIFRLSLLFIVAVATLIGFLFSWNLANIYLTYRDIPNRPLTQTEVLILEKKLGEYLGDAYRYVSLPPFKQAISLFSSRFFEVQPDFTFLAQNSLTLAGYGLPKKYMLVFQNSAEARGTGGILGAYAIIELKNGKVRVIEAASNLNLKSVNVLPIRHSDEYFKLYGNNPGIWQNANLSPHFPYGAENYLELWRLQTGEKLDGVIAIDPIALSYILRSTGDIELPDATTINSNNLVEETLRNAYKRFEKDNYARKEFLVSIIKRTFEHFQLGDFRHLTLLDAIAQSITEKRLLIYVTMPNVQTTLENHKFSGALTLIPDNVYRVIVQNTDASKLDYYLEREINLESMMCNPKKLSQITIYLRNEVVNPTDLPAYVLTRADKGKPRDLVTGQHRFKVYVYGPYGSELIGGSLGSGKNGNARVAFERGRPIFIEDLDLAPEASEVVVVQFSGGYGKLSYLDQPLVKSTLVQVKDAC